MQFVSHACLLTHSPLVKYWGDAACYSRKSTTRWVLITHVSLKIDQKYLKGKLLIWFLSFFSPKRATESWINGAPQSCQTWSGGGRHDPRQNSGGNSCRWQRSIFSSIVKWKLFFLSCCHTSFFSCVIFPPHLYRKGEGPDTVEATQHSWAFCRTAALLQGNHGSMCWFLWS